MTAIEHSMQLATKPLYLDTAAWRQLLMLCGPSLALWRAAEVAVLREQHFERPILDLGCGDGLITSLVLWGVEFGLDPWREQLQQAQHQGIYDHLIPARIEEVALPAGTIATVLCNSVLEHLEHIDASLAAAGRLLSPGGRLIFTTPTESFGKWLVLPLDSYARWRNRQLLHLNLWTVEHWAERLGRAGFAVEEVRPFLRRRLVWLWDALELLQQLHVRRRRLFGVLWRRLPPAQLQRLADRARLLDLAAPAPGGGRLIVARKK